jgi:hypothetical protein
MVKVGKPFLPVSYAPAVDTETRCKESEFKGMDVSRMK